MTEFGSCERLTESWKGERRRRRFGWSFKDPLAARNGKVDIMKVLLNGADAEYSRRKNHGTSPCTMMERADVAKVLAKATDVNAVDKYKMTGSLRRKKDTSTLRKCCFRTVRM